MVPTPARPPQAQDTAIVMIHDARAVYDTASFRFRDFRKTGTPDWTTAKATPGLHSGSATIPGAFINIDTGEFVTPAGVQPVVTKNGSLAIIAVAPNAKTEAGAKYSWSEPSTEEKRSLVPEDYYSPFANGGTIVFRDDSSAKGIDQFQSARLIFPDWAKDVAPASAFVESHPRLLENGEQQSTRIVQLRQLLADNNRFLAVEAFRELEDGGHLDINLAFEHLTHAEAPLDAILSYLVLSSRSDELAGQVNAAIRVSRDEKKLQSIALGAFSALLFRSQDPRILARSKAALQHVRSKVQELKLPLEKDSYLYLVLSKAGVL